MWFFEELIGVDLSYFLKKTVFLDQFVMEFFVAEWLGGLLPSPLLTNEFPFCGSRSFNAGCNICCVSSGLKQRSDGKALQPAARGNLSAWAGWLPHFLWTGCYLDFLLNQNNYKCRDNYLVNIVALFVNRVNQDQLHSVAHVCVPVSRQGSTRISCTVSPIYTGVLQKTLLVILH